MEIAVSLMQSAATGFRLSSVATWLSILGVLFLWTGIVGGFVWRSVWREHIKPANDCCKELTEENSRVPGRTAVRMADFDALKASVAELARGVPEDTTRRAARAYEVNGVGENVNAIEKALDTHDTRIRSAEGAVSLIERDLKQIAGEQGETRAALKGLQNTSVESSTAIIAHINDARREASLEASSIRERLSAIEKGSDVAVAIERAIAKSTERLGQTIAKVAGARP